jgi:glutaredoxin
MAGQRRERRPSEGGQAKSEALRKLGILLLIAAAFAGAYSLGWHRRGARLDAFAQCLAATHTKMYGAFWCPHCADQKALFRSSFQFVSYVECGIPGSRQENETCLAAGVKRFPTWEFAGGERREGFMQLAALSEKTGCGLP